MHDVFSNRFASVVPTEFLVPTDLLRLNRSSLAFCWRARLRDYRGIGSCRCAMPADGGGRLSEWLLLCWFKGDPPFRAVAARPAGHLSGFHPVEPHTPE